MITSVNPATGEPLATYPDMTTPELRAALAAADKAFRSWQRVPFAGRAALMRRAAALLREHAEHHARLMAQEMGKPIRGARAEVEKSAWALDHYAEHAAAFLADDVIETDAGRSFVTYRPLGPVLAIMPWNFPYWQIFRVAAPSLMAGNVVLLKHAANVPGCALAIEEVFREAGFPVGAFRTLLIDHAQLRTAIRHKAVRAVTLTGSTVAGRLVARLAAERLKKTVLELGGNDPYLILADADLEQAVEACAISRLINSGQSCIAAKRFVVVDAVREEFERRLVERMRRAVTGSPLSEDTDVGPLARLDLRDTLHQQVDLSVAAGARVLLGGAVPSGAGAFYPPTVLTDVARGMPAYHEELFGPVAAIIPVRNTRAAIKVANDSVYGLGAAVFTRDVEEGTRIAAEELEAGSCFVNGFVKSDPRLPFGGIKESGYGRELGVQGIREFVNVKTVWVK
jgi:succinate-semialdehyde dehydrogenase/glutarate-semialdehyde dehydrogenase